MSKNLETSAENSTLPNHRTANMSCDNPPSADEQRQTIASLEQEEESLHVYCIAKDWYKKWQNYVGMNDTQTPVKTNCPGSLTMHRGDDTRNMLVDEKIWRKWVLWYGVADSHELDRRNWASDEKDFEICMLSPYSNIVENPKKTFDISEESGYIEVQLRKIFCIAACVKSRLWACEKTSDKRFQLVLDRTREICFQDAIDHTRRYILALEACQPDGSWPTHVPGEPKGDFDKYLPLIEGPRRTEFWEEELASAVTCVFDGIGNELRETVDGVVKTMKCVNVHKEKDMRRAKEKFDTKIKQINKIQKGLDEKVRVVFQEEQHLKAEAQQLEREREKVEKDRGALQKEIQHMSEMNKIRESRIKLDIGGHVYTTSTLTLTKDLQSMLAAMFSGRHCIKREDDGSYFIDRDGTHFRYILNYLRDGGFKDGALPSDHGVLNELLTEAEYYQLGGLVALLQSALFDTLDDSTDKVTVQRGGRTPYRKVALRK